jgi:hypothetical protein
MNQTLIQKITRRIIFVAFVISIGILAVLLQNETSRAAKDDWLPIAPEDLALKDNPASPGAHTQ